VGDVSVALSSTTKSPSTTMTPSMLVFAAISTGETAQAPVAAAQKVVQVVVTSQAVPPALHVCWSAPEQRVAPAVQAPVQRPFEQPAVQTALSSHAVPPLLQLSTMLPGAQRTAPAVQVP